MPDMVEVTYVGLKGGEYCKENYVKEQQTELGRFHNSCFFVLKMIDKLMFCCFVFFATLVL